MILNEPHYTQLKNHNTFLMSPTLNLPNLHNFSLCSYQTSDLNVFNNKLTNLLKNYLNVNLQTFNLK